MKQTFIVNIPIKDRDGRIVGQKQVVKYEGLLAQAHEEGLRSIHTELVQIPTSANADVAIVKAVVVTNRGTFEGLGDASPSNTRMTGALLRVAETRAKARSLRDAVNVGLLAIDELEDVDEVSEVETPARSPVLNPPVPVAPANANVSVTQPELRDDLISGPQRRLLFRIAAERGIPTDEIQAWLEMHWGLKSLKTLSKHEASRLIEKLKANGHAGAAQ